jgi:nucleoside-diphosphate-sugar epimerase
MPNTEAYTERILVTGSSGFIGSRLSEHIKRFHEEVFLYDWNRAKNGSIQKTSNIERVLQEFNPNIIINCAWLSTENISYKDDTSNTEWERITFNLHEIANRHCIEIYSIGTYAEVDMHVDNQYINSKRMVLKRLRESGLLDTSCWIRPTYIFSWSGRRPHIIRKAFSHSVEKQNLLMQPMQLNDFIHVNDVVSALLHCVQRKKTGIADIGSGIMLSNEAFLDIAIAKRENLDIEDKCMYELNSQKHFFWRAEFTEKILT